MSCSIDSLILKSRQRYNRPHSLTTRVDLAELSKELKLRPPHLVSPAEVEPPSLPNGLHRGAGLNNVSGKTMLSMTLYIVKFYMS
jgi:hypothetical protein